MLDPRLLDALAPLAEAFKLLDIDYQVGGSLASSVHGVPRSSLDIDLLAALTAAKVPAFVETIKSAYYVSESRAASAVERASSFNVIHLSTMFKVDIFIASDQGFPHSSLQRRRRELLAEGVEFFVTSAEDIVLHKLDWYRRGGQVSNQQWQDVLGVLRVRGETLDMDYVRRWAAALDLGRLLEAAAAEAFSE